MSFDCRLLTNCVFRDGETNGWRAPVLDAAAAGFQAPPKLGIVRLDHGIHAGFNIALCSEYIIQDTRHLLALYSRGNI